MKVGVLARCDQRGLGVQTFEFWRNLPAHKALVLIAGVDRTNKRPLTPYAQHPERFDRGWVRTVDWNVPEPFPDDILRDFLSDLDVVFSAETFYHPRILALAREMNVPSVLQANPEFFSYHRHPDQPQPDAIWLPTSWLADRIPNSTVVPFPVNRAHIPYRLRAPSEPIFLHVVGHRTVQDRNGTLICLRALRYVRSPITLIIRSQDRIPGFRAPPHITVRMIVQDIDNYADLYGDGDVLLLPRKFGGQSLVLQEALASGLPVLMNDCAPQNTLLPPEMLIPTTRMPRPLRTQIGLIDMYDCHPQTLARRIDELYQNPSEVERLSKVADDLAENLSWDNLRPIYFKELAQVIATFKR